GAEEAALGEGLAKGGVHLRRHAVVLIDVAAGEGDAQAALRFVIAEAADDARGHGGTTPAPGRGSRSRACVGRPGFPGWTRAAAVTAWPFPRQESSDGPQVRDLQGQGWR